MKAFLASRALRNTLACVALALVALYATRRLEAGELAQGLALLVTGLALIRLTGLLAFRGLLPAVGIKAPRIAEEVVLLLAYAGWGLIRLRAGGMDLASLVTTSAVVTAVAAFAMQDTLGNVLGGLFLELDRSIAIGDWVRLDDLSGRVVEIRWRHTAIRTRAGELAIVPNAALMKARFIVIGDPDKAPVRWRRQILFDIAFDVPPSRVIAAAEQALTGAELPNVAREPAPRCILLEFTPSDCRYALRYWLTDPAADDGTDSVVRTHLLASLRRNGMAMRMPELFVHEIVETEARRRAQLGREIERRAAALHGIELFAGLTEAERRSLAERLVPAPFAAGDTITRQGAIAHWLYILASGEADVWLEDAQAPRRRVATLCAGNVFGEMGMMTGEPRRATVTARNDVECYRLDKEAFAGILRERPEIADGISRVLAGRMTELTHAAEAAHAEAAMLRERHHGVLERIRAFFGLETLTQATTP